MQFQDNGNIQIKSFDRKNVKDREAVQSFVRYEIGLSSAFSYELIAQTLDGTVCGYIDFSRKSSNMVYIKTLR